MDPTSVEEDRHSELQRQKIPPEPKAKKPHIPGMRLGKREPRREADCHGPKNNNDNTIIESMRVP